MALASTVVGLTLLALAGWFGSRQYTILKSWRCAEATVTRSQVHRFFSKQGNPLYQASVEFQYTVDGRTFKATSDPGDFTPDYDAMKRMADAYAPGTRHPIRYNPADPNDIRMNAGYNLNFFGVPALLGGVGLWFAGLGVGVMVASRRV